jgi:hypothetical protein
VVRCRLVQGHPEARLKRQAFVAPPADPPRGVDALEVADEEAVEVDAGSEARPTALLAGVVVPAAQPLNDRVEPVGVEHLVHPLVERVEPDVQVRRGDEQRLLSGLAFAQRGFAQKLERLCNLLRNSGQAQP